MKIDIDDAKNLVERVFESVETLPQLMSAERYGTRMMGCVEDKDLYKLLDKLSILTEYVETKIGDKDVH